MLGVRLPGYGISTIHENVCIKYITRNVCIFPMLCGELLFINNNENGREYYGILGTRIEGIRLHR